MRQRAGIVAALGTAQTLAWASSYYLPALLATPMSKDLWVSVPTVFLAISVALIVSARLGPYAGKAIDRWGADAMSFSACRGLLAFGALLVLPRPPAPSKASSLSTHSQPA